MNEQVCDICGKESDDLEEVDTGLGMEYVCHPCLKKENDEVE